MIKRYTETGSQVYLQVSEQLTYMYFNSLRLSDTIWRHRSGSTSAHVINCCTTAPSHYRNRCWRMNNQARWQSCRKIQIGNTSIAHTVQWVKWYIECVVQDCSISSALAMEILQSCTKASIYSIWELPMIRTKHYIKPQIRDFVI